MIKIAAFILAIALSPGISAAAQLAGTPQTSGMANSSQQIGNRVYVQSGNVFATQGNGLAQQVSGNQPISSGTLITTSDNSTALLKFEDGQIVTMKENSSFLVREYHYDSRNIENSSIVFSMFKGGMHFITGDIGQHSKQAFRLLTPHATINLRGTEFIISMMGNTLYSQVLDGKIRMTNASGTSILHAGQSAMVTSSSSTVSLLATAAIPNSTFNDVLSIPMHASVTPASNTQAKMTNVDEATDSRIYVVNGEVLVTQGKNPTHQVSHDELIASDTLVNTGPNSAALLKFEDGQIVTMKENSTFRVREYHYDKQRIENSSIVFSMFTGGMRFITGAIAQRRKQAFKLLTPNATIGIRGTEFMVALVDESLYSQVITGDISVTNLAGTTAMTASQSAKVSTLKATVQMISAAALPPGTFGDLLMIPIDPAEISLPAPMTMAAAPAAPAVPMMSSLSETDEQAQEQKRISKAEGTRSGRGLTAKIGTLGVGGEFSLGFSDKLSTRFGINAYNYKYTATSSELNYDFKLQLQSASIMADWYPFEGHFRTSGGLLYNNNKLDLIAVPTSGSYTINSVDYTTSQISSLQGAMSFKKAAPYLGIGWGNPVAENKGWGLVSDFGVMFQGQPKTSLTANCNPSPCDPSIQSNLDAENAKLENDLSNFKLWPVVSFGISYQW